MTDSPSLKLTTSSPDPEAGFLAGHFVRARWPESTAGSTSEDLQAAGRRMLKVPAPCRFVSRDVKDAKYEEWYGSRPDEWIAFQTRLEGLRDYIKRVQKEELVSSKVAALALKLWEKLSAATGNSLAVPDACTGPDGELLYAWDRGDHHCELEIELEAQPTFFYWNRKSGESWETDIDLHCPVREEVLLRLGAFISQP